MYHLLEQCSNNNHSKMGLLKKNLLNNLHKNLRIHGIMDKQILNPNLPAGQYTKDTSKSAQKWLMDDRIKLLTRPSQTPVLNFKKLWISCANMCNTK